MRNELCQVQTEMKCTPLKQREQRDSGRYFTLTLGGPPPFLTHSPVLGNAALPRASLIKTRPVSISHPNQPQWHCPARSP